jgi:hypothetical protein
MARHNKIYKGPVSENLPQTRERPASVAILPGLAVIDNGASPSKYALAGAATVQPFWIAQENYLAMEGVDTAYAVDDTVVALHPEHDKLFAVVIPTGVSVVSGVTELSLGASGKFVVATTGRPVVAYAGETYNNNTGSDQLVLARIALAGRMVP